MSMFSFLLRYYVITALLISISLNDFLTSFKAVESKLFKSQAVFHFNKIVINIGKFLVTFLNGHCLHKTG